VVGHQTIGLATPVEPFDHLFQRAEKRFSVLVVFVDRLAPIAPRGDVISAPANSIRGSLAIVRKIRHKARCYNGKTDPSSGREKTGDGAPDRGPLMVAVQTKA